MASHGTEPLPVAPYSLDLLADLHAGVLPRSTSDRLWPLVRQDRRAMEVMSGLDAVAARLGAIGTDTEGGEPMPPAVAERIDRALAEASLPKARSIGPSDRHRRPSGPRRAWLYAGMAAATLVVASVSALLIIRVADGTGADTAGPNDVGTNIAGDDIAGDDTLGTTGPNSEPFLALDSRNIDSAVVGRVVGRSGPTPLSTGGRLPECLAANGFDQRATVLGSAAVEVDGRPGTLLILPRDPVGGLTVLAVGVDCDAGNPDTLVLRDVN